MERPEQSEAAKTLLAELIAERDAKQAELDAVDVQIERLNGQRAAIKDAVNEALTLIRALERHQQQASSEPRR